ncbi:MAG: hypothetical protein BMS9Abin13_482 [Patescibacteria group bacterium]|nr:MAG: hypothetical protein BMS9Abin13_482 [Patescibacteria group bacterium]
MSYHIYKTEGFVVGSMNVGESNRFLYIFTKELGLVGASVQGVRELKSKLRFSLQDFSYANIDLVRGKRVWRVTNAQKLSAFERLLEEEHKQEVFVNISSLIKRLFAGEGGHGAVFRDVISGFTFLAHDSFTREELRNFEIILVIKILDGLGYWARQNVFSSFLSAHAWDKELLGTVTPLKPAALREIHNALKETHL